MLKDLQVINFDLLQRLWINMLKVYNENLDPKWIYHSYTVYCGFLCIIFALGSVFYYFSQSHTSSIFSSGVMLVIFLDLYLNERFMYIARCRLGQGVLITRILHRLTQINLMKSCSRFNSGIYFYTPSFQSCT